MHTDQQLNIPDHGVSCRSARRACCILALLFAASVLLGLCATNASAKNYVLHEKLEAERMPAPSDVAVDEGRHRLYVVSTTDGGNGSGNSGTHTGLVKVFDTATDPPTAIATWDERGNQSNIAVDPTAGTVFVEAEYGSIHAFQPDGTPFGGPPTSGEGSIFSMAVAANGNPLVGVFGGINEVDPSTWTSIRHMECSGCAALPGLVVIGIARDSEENLYVASYNDKNIAKWVATEGEDGIEYLESEVVASLPEGEVATDVELTPDGNILVVADETATEDMRVVEFDSHGEEVGEFGSGLPLLEASPGANPLSITNRLAVEPTTGRVYFANYGHPVGEPEGNFLGGVYVLDPLPEPTLTLNGVSNPMPSGMTLNATVNPGGEATTKCQFEYGTTNAYGTVKPCSPNPGEATTDTGVSATVSGLSPRQTIHYRVVFATDGGEVKTLDQTASSLAEPPTVLTGAASGVTQGAGTLNGSINPNGEATECHFEYGATAAYGATAQCATAPGEGGSAVSVSAALGDLTAGTTYHFRLVGESGGRVINGADATFTTLADTCATKAALCPPPPKTEEMPKPLKCKKGFKKKRVKGKVRCVRKKRHKKHRK